MTLQDMISKRLKPQEERQFHAAWLAKLGVPAQFRDAIVDHMPPNGLKKLVAYLLAYPIAFLAAIFVFVGLLTPLDALVTLRAAAAAAETRASLIHVDAGLSAVVMVFGLSALTGWISFAVFARRRTNGFPTGAAAMLNPPSALIPPHLQLAVKFLIPALLFQGLTQRLLAGAVRRAAREASTAEELLLGVARRRVRRWRIATIVLLPAAAVLTVLETNSFWLAGPSGIDDHRMFPPFYSQHYNIGDAMALTTGCDHSVDLDKDEFIYELAFLDGEKFNLGEANALEGTTLAAIEAIDVKLGSRIQYRQQLLQGRDPFHPLCLRRWVMQFDTDGGRRLAKLLHITAR